MAIIICRDWEILPDSKILKDPNEKRALGFLLYELAHLDNFAQIKTRLERLAQQRQELLDRHLELQNKTRPPLEPQDWLNKLQEVWNTVKSGYFGRIGAEIIRFEAHSWSPTDKERCAFEYFCHNLKDKAEELVAEAGEAP